MAKVARLVFITMLSGFVALFWAASCTWTVKPLVPTDMGVPEITPVFASSDKPVGSAPAAIDHAYGPLPPVATSAALYATDWFPLGSEVVVIAKDELIVMLRSFVVVLDPESVTCTVKVLVPVALGVPVMAPELAFSDKPAGSAPAAIVRAYGGAPPVTAITNP